MPFAARTARKFSSIRVRSVQAILVERCSTVMAWCSACSLPIRRLTGEREGLRPRWSWRGSGVSVWTGTPAVLRSVAELGGNLKADCGLLVEAIREDNTAVVK